MRSILRIYVLLSLMLLGACQSQAPLPTLAPSATTVPATATATITPTRTPFPTAEPSATPFVTSSDDPAQQSQIRIVDAATNVPALDVYIDQLALVNGIGFGQRTTASPIVAGTYTLSIVPSGGRLDDGALVKIPLEVKGQAAYALVIYGTNAALKAQVIALDVSPLKKTETRVQLFNTFADGGAVTLANALNNGVLIGDTAANTVSPVQAVAAGTSQLEIRAGSVKLADVDATLDPLKSSLFVLAGTSSDRATMQVIAVDAPVIGRGRVRLLGTITGVTDLDVYANDTLLTEGLGMGVLSDAATLPAGTYNLTLYPKGADRTKTDAITGTQIQLGADDDLIVALYGTENTISFSTLLEDVSPVPPGRARIVFFNPVPEATRVSVTSDVLPQILPVNYGRFSAALDVPARTTSFSWTQSDTQGTVTTLETALDLPIQAGESYLYVFNARGVVNFNFLNHRTVGESASANTSSTPTPIPPTAQPAPRLRMVNTIPDQFVEFRLDDVAVVRGLPFANASSSIITPTGEKTLTVHSSDGTQLLARTTITLEPNTSYTAYAYGTETPYNVLLVKDSPLYDPVAPSFRVVNLSTDNKKIGAALAPYSTTDGPSGEQAFNPGYSIPAGIIRLAYDLDPAAATDFAYTRVDAAQTVYILDADSDLVVMTLTNITFSPNMSYEVIIFKGVNLPLRAFVVTYPPA